MTGAKQAWVALQVIAFAGSVVRAEDAGETGSRFEETLAGYLELKLAGGGAPIGGLTFEQGHMRVSLASGRAAAVTAGGRPIGIFFEGEGRFEYTSADPVEHPVMSFNIRKATGLDPVKAGAVLKVGDVFRQALILVAGRELPAPAGEGSGQLAEIFAGHRDRFHRAALPPAAHLFVMRDLDAPDLTVARVEMSGGKEDLVYTFDPMETRSEWLWSLRKSESADSDLRRRLWPVLLSEQPIERDRRDPLASRLDLTAVDYTLTASAGDSATISVDETLVPQTPQRALRLDMDSTTWTVEGVGSRSVEPRAFNVRKVVDGAGAALPFHHDNGQLLVGLPATAPAGGPVKLHFEIDGDFLIHPGHDNYWVMRPGAWFPQPGLAGQRYTVHSVVKARKPWTPLAPGVTVARREEGDHNVLESLIEEPVMFTVALAGNYEVQETTREGLTIRVATYGGRNRIAMKEMTDLAFGVIEYFQTFLGPFPFKEYSIIQINDLGWGQAPPATMFITNEAFDSRTDDLAFLYTQGVNERIAHEIAHQYWGHVVKMPGLEEQWLTEAFAEYCAALFLKHRVGKVEYNAALATWKTSARSVREIAPIPLASRITLPLDPWDAYRKRFYLLYHKGAWLLSRLHAELGDQAFLTFLKSYQKSFRWKFGSTKHVAGLLQFMTKKDYTPFLEENYWGTGMPE